MFLAKEIKNETTNDYHKRNIYFFDSVLSNLISEKHKNTDQNHLININDIFDLTHAVLKNESLNNIKFIQNNFNNKSTCNFFKNEITYSSSHLKDKETVFHELAHYFDYLFSIPNLPAHGTGFLSALEYLLDKHKVISKSEFKNNLVNFNNKGYVKSSLPYVEDYYTVTELSNADYESELLYFTDNEYFINDEKLDRLIKKPTNSFLIKNSFEKDDYYINLIQFLNNDYQPVRSIKVIVKKLGYEMQQKDNSKYQVILSPKIKMNKNYYGTVSRETRKGIDDFSGIAIYINDNNLKPDLIVDLLNHNNTFSGLGMTEHDYCIYIRPDNTIFIGFCSYNYSQEFIKEKIKNIKNLFKNKRLKYYHSKSINDLYNNTKDGFYI